MNRPNAPIPTDAETAFDAALVRWLERQATAELRLTSFAFREGQADIEIGVPTSHAELRAWIMAVVAEPDIAAFFGAIAHENQPMADVVASGALGLRPGDRVSVAARIGVLTSMGLVGRELEADRVGLTELGRAALALR